MLAFFELSFGARSLSGRVYHSGVQTFSMGGITSVVAKEPTRVAGSRSYAEALVGAGADSINCHHVQG